MLVKLIVFLPLIAAVLVGLQTRKISETLAQAITTIAVATSAVLSWIVFYQVVIGKAPQIIELASWINSGSFNVSWTLRVDSLTAIMLTLVTTVSSLVHLYSVGYMHHDEHPQRFMSYLSLFTFFMLMLVTSDNLLQLFLGWEGVGLCSYLLIGFWFKKPSANAAAIKAFVVNRVGDFGLALGVFACFMVFGSIQFDSIFAGAANYSKTIINVFGFDFHALTVICVLLFIGAMGKSAQLGLHTWLPDAMEGPTPVSALIHAATMVTAGVFLVARFSPVFEYSEAALAMVTIVGALTAIFAATIALTQNDIKKIIAYSTCSQLGYMFFACGVSAYSAGVFHLFTHGFFKALLFLGAGSVIHAMSNEQDIRKMGGIWKKIPLTYAMMIIGTLAITGFPFLSGYYSKDAILESAFAAGEHGKQFAELAYWLGISAATLTAFYSWRLIFLTFHGKTRASKKVIDHIHESPAVMTIPLIILSIGALFAGAYYSNILGIVSPDLSFWNGAIFMDTSHFNVLEAMHHVPKWVILSPMIVGAAGFIFAVICYLVVPSLPSLIVKMFYPLYVLFSNKWFFDEIYDFIFVRPAKAIGSFFSKSIDAGVIDRFGPNGFSNASLCVGKLLKNIQSGYVYHYSFVMLLGLIAIISWYLF
jgi:NADH-quinone oxidoreductase subunit L